MMTAALVTAVPALAFAQTPGSTDTSTATATATTQSATTDSATVATASPQTASTQTSTTTTALDYDDDMLPKSHWMASGFVGSNFGDNVDAAKLDFGGSVGWMYRGAIGGEFLAGFSPDFQLSNNVLAEQPQVNTFMGNLVAAIPIGGDGATWQPFVSGGLGSITLNAQALQTGSQLDDVNDNLDPDGAQFAGNIGAGVQGWAGPVGLRADVRYFRALNGNDNNDSASDNNPVAQSILANLDFWRANIGVAFRW
jgi:hypothetical protein